MTPSSDDENLSDHDLLIRIDERTKKLDKCLTEHLSRHWALSLAAVGAAAAAIFSAAIAFAS